MPLYSTETQVNAKVGKQNNGQGVIPKPEVEICANTKEAVPWHYLFIHHAKVDGLCRSLEHHFPVFIHKSIVYRRENKKIRKEEKPTVSGLVFIQGDSKEIQEFLHDNFFGLFLTRDCSTSRTAAIPDSVMQPFMRMSKLSATRIRFMPHTFDYYSEGNALVRITSGVLAGLEGYRIRIARDKCLVTSIGGMTVAIGGIHNDSFENLDEYVRQRRRRLKSDRRTSDVSLTPLQQEISSCFFTPQTTLDIMAIMEALTPWMIKMRGSLKEKDFDEAVEIATSVLEEVGFHFRSRYDNFHGGDTKGIHTVCREIDLALLSCIDNEDVSTDLKEIVEARRESLAIRYPFLPIEL